MSQKEPYHLIKDMIYDGEYVSPQQCWYDIKDKIPRIYTKNVIMNLIQSITSEG